MPTRAPRSHHHTLLLLAAGIAGLGVSLACADDAHASDRDHTGLVAGTLGAVTDTTTALLPPAPADPTPTPSTTAEPTPPAATAKPTPPRAPARHLTAHTTRTVTAATTTVKTVTDKVDTATRDLPVVGRTVDKVTDVTDPVLDMTPTVIDPPTLPGLPHLPLLNPVDPRPNGGAPPTPQTAPEPAASRSPALPAVSSGAPNPHRIHPGRGAVNNRHTTSGHTQVQPALQPATDPHPHRTADCNPHPIAGSPGTDRQHSTLASSWDVKLTWLHAVTAYIGHHAGRTEPPSPPSG